MGIALWEDCTDQDSSSCCGNAVCFRDASHAACVLPGDSAKTPTTSPSTSQPIPPACTICDDRETRSQAGKGLHCTTDTWRIDNKCNKDAKWIAKKYCRLSCYKAGNGYPKDVCCDDSTNTHTASPTALHSTPPACTSCDDKENGYQIREGLDCATDTWWIDNRCNKDGNWIANKYCRLSCYKAGNGYPGDVCCDDSILNGNNSRTD